MVFAPDRRLGFIRPFPAPLAANAMFVVALDGR
jgi:hypothetical protein